MTPTCFAPRRAAADPTRVLRQVLSSLGLDISAANGVQPGVRKLADAQSDEWAARLRAEIAGG